MTQVEFFFIIYLIIVQNSDFVYFVADLKSEIEKSWIWTLDNFSIIINIAILPWFIDVRKFHSQQIEEIHQFTNVDPITLIFIEFSELWQLDTSDGWLWLLKQSSKYTHSKAMKIFISVCIFDFIFTWMLRIARQTNVANVSFSCFVFFIVYQRIIYHIFIFILSILIFFCFSIFHRAFSLSSDSFCLVAKPEFMKSSSRFFSQPKTTKIYQTLGYFLFSVRLLPRNMIGINFDWDREKNRRITIVCPCFI